MGTIKDRNGMDLTEAEDIKKRWQEYTEELYKKIFMTQIITMVKAQHSENEDHGIRSNHFMGNRWGNSGNSVRLYFSGLQNHYRW